MTELFPIAVITFKEGIRNRALYGILLLALLLLGVTQLVCGMIPQHAGKVAVDLSLSTVSLAGLLLVLFVGINLLAKDLDRKTIYVVLSRPISRVQYLVGKFLGMVFLLFVTVGLLSLFALASIALAKLGYAGYFPRFSWFPVVMALVFSFLGLVLLSALTFLFASFSSSSFITLVLTIVSYLIGHSIGDVKALVEAPQVAGIEVSPVALRIVQAAYYMFPNLSLFDLKTQAAHGLPIPPSYLLWCSGYGLAYTAVVISCAALLFRRREFP